MSDEATETTTGAPETLDDALGDGSLGDEIEAELAGGEPTPTDGPTAEPLHYDQLSAGAVESSSGTVRDLDLIADVDVEVAVEFGRVDIPIRQILQIRRGSLVELHRRPEAQVTVLANGKPIALGDIVVVDGQVGVHIVELIDPESAQAPISPPAQVILEEAAADEPDHTDGADADAAGDAEGETD
ncbi:MAG: FliM/FliN family flagellar motor switch protein [Actinomycetota bacterium]